MHNIAARKQAISSAGIETAHQMALTAAVTLEIRDDAREVRQQAAAAALQGLAAGLKVAFLAPAVKQTDTLPDATTLPRRHGAAL